MKELRCPKCGSNDIIKHVLEWHAYQVSIRVGTDESIEMDCIPADWGYDYIATEEEKFACTECDFADKMLDIFIHIIEEEETS